MENDYKITKQDRYAKFFCNERGLVCEPIPTATKGNFRIGIFKGEKWLTTRKIEFKYRQKEYAVYESYRALFATIIENEKSKNI